MVQGMTGRHVLNLRSGLGVGGLLLHICAGLKRG
jgi:hypothetical protein